MSHLSDEAVAAFADGVLRGHARERASRHVEECTECHEAVRVQREAACALRAAPAPQLPIDLAARLRSLPQTTALPAPVTVLPTVVAPDGSPMLATFAPMAALVAPSTSSPAALSSARTSVVSAPAVRSVGQRVRPYVATAAAVALAGSLVATSMASGETAPAPAPSAVVDRGTAVGTTSVGTVPAVVAPVHVFTRHP